MFVTFVVACLTDTVSFDDEDEAKGFPKILGAKDWLLTSDVDKSRTGELCRIRLPHGAASRKPPALSELWRSLAG
jgi:hypothetical protein